MGRRFLALVAAMGLAFLASILFIEWKTRPAARGPSPSTHEAAVPLPRPTAASTSPAPVRGQPAATAASPPQPVVARAAQPERPRGPGPAPVPGVPRVDFSFKLDPRLTSGVHLGPRWVSPPTYTRTGDLKSVTVDARARVVDGGPQRPHANVAWRASEPDMVEVSPEQGNEVKLTVWRPGESRVTADAGGVSGTLVVRAAEVGGKLRIDIAR